MRYKPLANIEVLSSSESLTLTQMSWFIIFIHCRSYQWNCWEHCWLKSVCLPIRRSHTLCPVWSRRHSGSAEPWDSGREGRRWAGSPAGGRSCDGCDCTCTHGGAGGCRGDLAQVSAGFTPTHIHIHTQRWKHWLLCSPLIGMSFEKTFVFPYTNLIYQGMMAVNATRRVD